MVRHSKRSSYLRQTLSLLNDALLDEELTSMFTGQPPESLVSDGLVDYHIDLNRKKHTAERSYRARRPHTFFPHLKRLANLDPKMFRGLTRMKPRAFFHLANRLRLTKALGNGKHSEDWVGQRLAVWLYRLGRSGNGSGVRDTSTQCQCSVGSVVNWTNMILAGLEELEPEIMTFATEDERARASAWVQEKTGVEDWGRGWLAVDGTLIDLASRPGLNQREYFTHKGTHALNIAPVVLPHQIVAQTVFCKYSSIVD